MTYSTKLTNHFEFPSLILLLTLLPPSVSHSASGDPCTDASQTAISAARQYQKGARTVKSTCTKVDGDCVSAEINASSALDNVASAHQVMIDACGTTTTPPPPPPAESPTLSGDLVINEVMAGSGFDDDWFEVFNPTDTDFDLNGLGITIFSTKTLIFDVSDTLVVPAHGYVVFGYSANSYIDYGLGVDTHNLPGETFHLPDEGFILSIRNGTTTLDEVNFSGATFSYPASEQLDVNSATATDNDSLENWCTAIEGFLGGFGTPGASNSACF